MFPIALLRYIPHAVAAAALIGGVLFVRSHWINEGRAQMQAEWNREKLDYAAEKAELLKAARQKEQKHAFELNAADVRYLEQIKNEKQITDTIIGDLRNGNARLRTRFTCGAASDRGSMSQASASTSERDAATEGGLQRTDAEFLISESARADEVVLQLQACQAVVKSDRK